MSVELGEGAMRVRLPDGARIEIAKARCVHRIAPARPAAAPARG